MQNDQVFLNIQNFFRDHEVIKQQICRTYISSLVKAVLNTLIWINLLYSIWLSLRCHRNAHWRPSISRSLRHSVELTAQHPPWRVPLSTLHCPAPFPFSLPPLPCAVQLSSELHCTLRCQASFTWLHWTLSCFISPQFRKHMATMCLPLFSLLRAPSLVFSCCHSPLPRPGVVLNYPHFDFGLPVPCQQQLWPAFF